MKKINPIAGNIWAVFAHIQGTFDDIFDMGFKKLSKANQKKLPEKANKVKKVAYKFGGFLGDIGKSYYEKYTEIKKNK